MLNVLFKKNLILTYGFVFIAPVLTAAYFPPTATSLLQKEHVQQQQVLLSDLEKVVERVIKKHRKKRRRRPSKNQKRKPRKKVQQPTLQGYQQKTISRELRSLVAQQYEDPTLQKKVTVRFQDIDIISALRLIAKMAELELVVDADVHGKINYFNFNDVAVGSALNIVLNNNLPRLALVKHLGIWRVVRASVAFELLSLQEEAMQEKNTHVMSRTISHAKWEQAFKDRITALWKCIVGVRDMEKHYLMFDDASKKVFFKGSKQQLAELGRYLDEIDTIVPQVRIEARVVMADKDFEEGFGFQWSGVYNRSANITQRGYGYAGLGVGGGVGGPAGHQNSGSDPSLYKDLLGWSLNFIPSKLSNAFNIKLPFVWGNKDFTSRRLNLMLNAAENKNEIKTIMKPTLLVNSGEPAEILVGQELPQEVRLQETVVGAPTNITTVQYKDIGLKIKVQPQVNADRQEIFLDIFVESSSVMKSPLIDIGMNAGAAQPHHFNYTIKTSRSKNRVLLKSGQTTLIGGLLVDQVEHEKNGIPLLQEIPVLGWLFQGKRNRKRDEQLLIFITPTLL